MSERRQPVVTSFDRWSAAAAVLVGVGVNLPGVDLEAQFDTISGWLRLALCVLAGFTFLGLALVRSRRFGNDQHSRIVSPFETPKRQSITARSIGASTPAALAPVRSRYAHAREETKNRRVLLFGATATIFGAEP